VLVEILFSVALTMSALYALACTAALFAAEREEMTHEFLCLHAPSSRELIAGKVIVGLLSTAGLMVVLWLVAALLAGGRLPETDVHFELGGTMGLVTLEMFAWGTFFSLLLKHPLRAAILTAVAISASAFLLALLSGASRLSVAWGSAFYLNALPAHLGALAVLVAVDIGLIGPCWVPACLSYLSGFAASHGKLRREPPHKRNSPFARPASVDFCGNSGATQMA